MQIIGHDPVLDALADPPPVSLLVGPEGDEYQDDPTT